MEWIMIPNLEFLHASPFYELTAVLVLAAVLGFIGQLLRQPMIVSFIVVGVLAGPSALGVVKSLENIELLAELGIAVLLFLVGLKLDLKLVKTLGAVSLATGLGQVLFTSLIGFGIGIVLGLDTVTSLYVAVALTFSSTIIIVKLLSDKREVDSLHGRIAIGFLIVQDLVVVLAMMVLSAFGIGTQADTDHNAWMQIVTVLIYGAIMLAIIGVFIRYLATPLMARIARSPELMIIFAIGWAALLAALGNHLGFSKELGGLLAGVSLASTPFREAIVSRLSSLRDFLLLFFFVALGAKLDLSQLGAQVYPAMVFSVFVLIGNPLIVMAIMGAMGYRKRTGLLAGLTVAQISEFSLIFMAMGVTLGHVNSDSLALVTLVGLVTIALSVYMITYSHTLYSWLQPVLGIFERGVPVREQLAEQTPAGKYGQYDVILFGLGRYGASMLKHLRQDKQRVLAIDFNPDEVRHWRSQGVDAVYGDACDQELLNSLPIHQTRWVLSAMPQHEPGLTHEDPRLVLLDGLKQHDYAGKVAVSTHNIDEVELLKARGADMVFLPFADAGLQAVQQIRESV